MNTLQGAHCANGLRDPGLIGLKTKTRLGLTIFRLKLISSLYNSSPAHKNVKVLHQKSNLLAFLLRHVFFSVTKMTKVLYCDL